MKVLLFTGAGASAELGILPMRPMAEELLRHLEDQQFPKAALEYLRANLADDKYDMEQVIDELDGIEKARRTGARWGVDTSADVFAEAETLRQETEWLVGHLCEKIDTQAASLMWGECLVESEGSELTIATTNYDRAIEIASAQVGIRICDGFSDFEGREYAEWSGLERSTPEGNELLKLHGSTDWYHSAGRDSIVKLRHPMPLFGPLRIVLDGGPNLELRSAAVLPSREKKTTELPYPELNAKFWQRADEASAIIFVGTSLRDPDIRSLCVRQSGRKPTYVVCRSNLRMSLPESVKFLRQCASKFLISTLPSYLRQDDPTYLDRVSNDPDIDGLGILDDLVDVFDRRSETARRCAAVEALARRRVALSMRLLEPLVRSEDADVSKFALGLVADSPHCGQLLDIVRCLDRGGDEEFAREVSLLEALVTSS